MVLSLQKYRTYQQQLEHLVQKPLLQKQTLDSSHLFALWSEKLSKLRLPNSQQQKKTDEFVKEKTDLDIGHSPALSEELRDVIYTHRPREIDNKKLPFQIWLLGIFSLLLRRSFFLCDGTEYRDEPPRVIAGGSERETERDDGREIRGNSKT